MTIKENLEKVIDILVSEYCDSIADGYCPMLSKGCRTNACEECFNRSPAQVRCCWKHYFMEQAKAEAKNDHNEG